MNSWPKECQKNNDKQSPIDIPYKELCFNEPFEIAYKKSHILEKINTGNFVQINGMKGYTVLQGIRYNLAYFNFHQKSEHTLRGQQYDAEIHFVHLNPVDNSA